MVDKSDPKNQDTKKPRNQETKMYYLATGKRKRAVARVRIKEGTGKRIANGKELNIYFTNEEHLKLIEEPLVIAKPSINFDVCVKLAGGGKSGQAEAVSLGIARALLKYEPELRKLFKPKGLLRRDPREKERKKYCKKKARKSFQWTKR